MTPRERRWRIADPFLTGQKQHDIDIAGLDWGGDGPIALLHHANGFCAATWALVADRLSARYRVVAIDARGHGDSDTRPVPDGYRWEYLVSDLAQVAGRLLAETQQPSIALGVGSSLGGIITAGAESANPGLFQRIAMLDPPIHPSEAQLVELGLAPLSDSQLDGPNIAEQARKRSAVWPSRDTARDAWRNKPMFSTWRSEAFEAYLQAGFRDRDDGSVELKCDPQVEATIFETAGSLDTFEFAPRVAAPVLLIRAGEGHFPPIIFEHAARLFPNCSYQVVDAGHLLPMESPGLVIELLEDFAPPD